LVTWEHAINWQGSSSSEDDADTADSEDDADAADSEDDADAAGSDDDADTAGNEGDADTAVPQTNQKSLASDAHLVSLEHSQLLVANSSSSLTSSNAMLQLACSPPPARKPEPLTLRNHTLLSCQWLDNVRDCLASLHTFCNTFIRYSGLANAGLRAAVVGHRRLAR
jgi:hypothetical protein